MKIEEVRNRLEGTAITIVEEKRLRNETGTQLRLSNGSIVNVFDTGTCNVQGTGKSDVESIIGIAPWAAAQGPAPLGAKRKVFVVYGHDQRCRDQLEATLRRWGLEPLILDQLASQGQTVIEKLESAMAEAAFAVVLATPDDEGHRAGHADEKAFRARQNVVLEMGMLLARLGRTNVAILLKEQEKMDRPSDIQGLIYIPFRDDLAKDAGVTLAKAMVTAGYQLDIAKL